MHKKVLKKVALVLSGLLALGSLATSAIPSQAAGSVAGENGYETTYQLTSLTKAASWNVDINTADTGKVSLEFAAGSEPGKPAYGEAIYEIPEDVLNAGLLGYTCNAGESDTGYLALKLRDKDSNQACVSYGNRTLFVPTDYDGSLKQIGIMSTSPDAYTITVENIVFYTSNPINAGSSDESDSSDTDNSSVRDYDVSQLNPHFRWNPGTVVSDTLEFPDCYYEYCIDLPEAIPFDNIENVTIKVAEQTGSLCFKFYNTVQNNSGDVSETDVKYGNIGKTQYAFTPVGTGSLASIGIMSHEEKRDDNYPFTARIEGVSIKLKEKSSDLPSDPGENKPDNSGNKVYTDITFYNRWNSSDTCTGTISFSGQWNEYCFDLSAALDMADCGSITVKMTGQGGQVAFKVYDAAKNELKAYYNNSGKEEYTFIPDFTGKAACFAIMSTDSSADSYPYTVTVESITFAMNGETEEQLSDNILLNPDFADADHLDMWKAANGNAAISACRSDADLIAELPGVKTYGMISSRTSNYECIAQDVTAAMQKNAEYQFTFYAMLDAEDYADAPETQRTVELSPMLTSNGETHYSQGVTGKYKQVLTPGVWTKFSGIYTPSWNGDLDSVVLRFLEQGEDYGSGAGVKGKYYVTGFNMQQIITPEKSIQNDIVNLKDAVTDIMGDNFIMGTSICNSDLNDDLEMQLVTKHFNAITLGNELKPDAMFGYATTCPATESITLNGKELVVPKLDFSRAEKTLDYIYNWNQEHSSDQIRVRGHVLVWHSQTPEWFFHENYDAEQPYVDKDTMTLRQEWYIKSVAEHFTSTDSKYRDLFYGWDVVNEAVSDGRGTYRNASENSSWWAVYQSNEYITNAFVFANKYLPASVELYYNDYNEWFDNKVKGIVQLLTDVKNTEGARIDGMGMQGHYQTSVTPTMEQFEKAVRTYCEVVGKVQITELDFKASDSYDGTTATQAAEDERLAARYKALYDTIRRLNNDGCKIDNITVWGVIDKYSWLQTSGNVGGASDGTKKQCPLLFDDNYQAKPAFWALAEAGELTPVIKKPVLNQTVDNSFTGGNIYTFLKDSDTVSFVPVWDGNSIRVQVTVPDGTSDENDKVTLYIAVGDTVFSSDCSRSESKEITGGYIAELSLPLDTTVLQPANTIGFDLTVTDGDKKYAYNDTTLNHAESSNYFSLATLKPCVAVTKGTIKVDGKANDKAWKNAVTIPLTINLGSEVSASAKLLWDESYLYVYAEIIDNDLNKDNADAYQQDSLEVFIDENNHKTDSYEEDDKQYRINYENTRSFNGTKCLDENLLSSAVLTDSGYFVEVAFKWTDLTPVDGTAIGLELQINDANATGKRIGTLSWSDRTGMGWSSTNVYGTVILKDDSSKPGHDSGNHNGGNGNSQSVTNGNSSQNNNPGNHNGNDNNNDKPNGNHDNGQHTGNLNETTVVTVPATRQNDSDDITQDSDSGDASDSSHTDESSSDISGQNDISDMANTAPVDIDDNAVPTTSGNQPVSAVPFMIAIVAILLIALGFIILFRTKLREEE